MAIALDTPGPALEAADLLRTGAEQRRVKMERPYISLDRRRFAQQLARIALQRRHRAARINRQIGVAKLLAALQVDGDAFQLHRLLSEKDVDPARTVRPFGIVELDGQDFNGAGVPLAFRTIDATARGPQRPFVSRRRRRRDCPTLSSPPPYRGSCRSLLAIRRRSRRCSTAPSGRIGTRAQPIRCGARRG